MRIKIAISVFSLTLAIILTASPATYAQTNDEFLQLQAAYGEIKDDVKRCADTVDRVGRLLCFDQLSNKLGLITEKQLKEDSVILGTYGFWDVMRKTNEVGEVHTYVKIQSNTPVKSRSGTIKKPELVIKCRMNDTQVYLDWKTALKLITTGYDLSSKYMYIIHSFNNEPRPGVEWELSLDKYAAFVPDPIGFVRDMKDKKTLALQLTPQGDANQTVIFTLDGFDKALEHIIQDCYNS